MAADSTAFGRVQIAAGQERKPDAGASAGDKSLVGPVARQVSERLDIGRQAWLRADEAEGSPDASRARVIHTPVRVGSAAMPAPFALRGPVIGPLIGRRAMGGKLTAITFAAAGIRRFGKPSSRRKHAFREIVPQRFVANLGRLVRRTVARNDELPARFAFDDHPDLSPPRCRRECAYRASGPSGCNRLLLRHCWGWHHLAPLLPQLQMPALRASILLSAPPQSNWFRCRLRSKCRHRR